MQLSAPLTALPAMASDPKPPNPSDSSLSHSVVGSRGESIGDVTLHALEGLDDAVFEALAGDPKALDEATRRWRDAVSRVNPKLLEESRRQYARRARFTWRHAQQALAERLPLAHAALEILGLVNAKLDPAAEGQRDRKAR